MFYTLANYFIFYVQCLLIQLQERLTQLWKDNTQLQERLTQLQKEKTLVQEQLTMIHKNQFEDNGTVTDPGGGGGGGGGAAGVYWAGCY